MIHVFHGFLGHPSDFDFLSRHTEVTLHDLYSELTVNPAAEDILIGYSMGGRIALQLAHQVSYRIKKLVLINAHPGLPTPAPERTLWEDSVVERLSQLSPEEFLKYWNALPLFKHDQPLTHIEKSRFDKSLALFERNRLSRQPCFLPDLNGHAEKVLCLSGTLDEKYAQVARDLIAPCGVKCLYLKGGHRLFQQPELIIDALKAEHIL